MQTLISIEGIIGAGKTFFHGLISKHTDIPVINEPICDWTAVNKSGQTYNVLEAFYDDPATYAYDLQMVILKSLAKQRKNVNHGCIERSMKSNRMFSFLQHQNGNISDTQYKKYLSKFEDISKQLTKVSARIYIKTSVDTAMKRIKQRARPGEEHITREYLKLLEACHECWLMEAPNVFVVDGELDLTDETNVKHVMRQLSIFLSES
jgi:deoxyadenosine/deoxycytidine kinase